MRKKSNIKVFATSLLLLSILVNIIICLNLHYHIVSNGNIIVHGHPYNKSQNEKYPIATHSHSQSEFLLNHSLNNIETVICFLFVFTFIITLLRYLSIFFKQHINNNAILLFPFLRAPPLDFS